MDDLDSPWKEALEQSHAHRSSLWGSFLAYAGRIESLEANPNLFAAVAMAHVKMLETRQDDRDRQYWKTRVVNGLRSRPEC